MATEYRYQNIVDNSNPITVTRPVDIKALKDLIKNLQDFVEMMEKEKEPKVSWEFICSPPERVFSRWSNAPAYVPKAPTAVDHAKWLAWQGVKVTIDNSYRRVAEYSRILDRDCRSTNFEKFDDETFIGRITWANDEATKQELEELRDKIIINFAQGKDLNGNPISMESTQEICSMLKTLNERIQAKCKNTQ